MTFKSKIQLILHQLPPPPNKHTDPPPPPPPQKPITTKQPTTHTHTKQQQETKYHTHTVQCNKNQYMTFQVLVALTFLANIHASSHGVCHTELLSQDASLDSWYPAIRTHLSEFVRRWYTMWRRLSGGHHKALQSHWCAGPHRRLLSVCFCVSTYRSWWPLVFENVTP